MESNRPRDYFLHECRALMAIGGLQGKQSYTATVKIPSKPGLEIVRNMTYKLTMIRYNVSEAKAKFSAVMESVEAGNSVVLCKRNRPVATLQPVATHPAENKPRHHTRIGWASGEVRIHGDLEEPALPASDWEMLS